MLIEIENNYIRGLRHQNTSLANGFVIENNIFHSNNYDYKLSY